MNSPLIEEMSYLCTHNQIRQTMKKEIYLAGGCFWGTEHYFKQIQGVISTEVGFANGYTDNPTYQEVYTDQTGYAETVHIEYDEQVYYVSDDQLPIINKVFAEQQALYPQPIAVEKLPLRNFYTAEEYHQDYLDKNPDGYCHLPTALFDFARQAKDTTK